MGTIIRAKINRSNNSMGLALAGHRNRNEMGCFIAGINPKGAAISQNFKVSDEILEVSAIYCCDYGKLFQIKLNESNFFFFCSG